MAKSVARLQEELARLKAREASQRREKEKQERVRHSKGKSSGKSSDEVGWVKSRELDPSASLFPLSEYGHAINGARNEMYLKTMRLGFDSAVTADGSGVYAGVISNSPVQAQNWTNYAAVFEEYRVLAFKVVFEPAWTVNITFMPLTGVIDRSDSTALTSYSLAERFASCKKVS